MTHDRDDDDPGRHPPSDPRDVPETPPDEPKPAPVQDPPADPNTAPRVVSAGRAGTRAITTDAARNRTMMNAERKERRGFASMTPEKQREIASKGGRAAHQKGTAHEWTSEEARSAGRKGGQISRGGRGRLVTSEESAGQPDSLAAGIPTIND